MHINHKNLLASPVRRNKPNYIQSIVTIASISFFLGSPMPTLASNEPLTLSSAPGGELHEEAKVELSTPATAAFAPKEAEADKGETSESSAQRAVPELLFGPGSAVTRMNPSPVDAIRSAANKVASTVKDYVASATVNMLNDPNGVIQRGIASWYGDAFHSKLTANGERFNMNAMTAAHRSLPFGTRLCAYAPSTGRTIKIRINDRGPFIAGRVIDLSKAAAKALGIHNKPDMVTLSSANKGECSSG